jgi:hypothetical protein
LHIGRYILLTLILTGWYGELEARVIDVPGEFATIQGGIDAAENGDSVVIAPGRYKEFEIDFRGKAITVMSTDPTAPEIVATTIVDADSLGRVFYFQSGEHTTSVLSGLTILGGRTDYWGGGIRCTNSSPTITHNVITENSAEYGGGGIWCESSAPVIRNNIIVGNEVNWGGGGIRCSSASPEISNNIIGGNHAAYGGGIDCHYSSSPTISNNVIAGNRAGKGGGVYCYQYSSPVIVNNTISGNDANQTGGGIMSKGFSSPIVRKGTEIFIGGSSDPSEVIISYSLVEGGLGSVSMDSWCSIDWGEGMINSDPIFSDGAYHLEPNSPCIDSGDPSLHDSCRPPGLRGTRSDMGSYGGENNCWSPEAGLRFVICPDGPRTVPSGEFLFFDMYILNIIGNSGAGDYWLSVMFPDSSEVLIPPGLLNRANPLSGRIAAFGSIRISNEFQVPKIIDSGHYALVGRIGIYPTTIIDEESFGFYVIERYLE